MSDADLTALLEELRRSAASSHHRRLVLLSGSRSGALVALQRALGTAPLVLVTDGPESSLPAAWRLVSTRRFADLLGSTVPTVALDLHDQLSPNAVGALSGVVDGGGLLLLLCPEHEGWAGRPDRFCDRLVVAPYGPEDVGRRFLQRFLAASRGAQDVCWVNVDAQGRTARLWTTAAAPCPAGPQALVSGPPDATSREDERGPEPADESAHGEGAEVSWLVPGVRPEIRVACRSADQAAAVGALAWLARRRRKGAVVLVADRGRGKSSALGLFAAQEVARAGQVVVTGPGLSAAAEVLRRAAAALDALPRAAPKGAPEGDDDGSASWGSVRFRPALDAAEEGGALLLVDEAARLPVPLLERLLARWDRVAFATTVHGYEGTGRGFDLRFQARLRDDGRALRRVELTAPIRWSPGDPVEAWCRAALLLDAQPAAAEGLADARLETVTVERPAPAELAADEARLRQTVGLLTLAHYRTTPEDLARILDAPNLRTRLLTHRGQVAAVCLVAEEGRLPAGLVEDLYLGRRRVRGHMLPECLVSHLGVEEAGPLPMGRIVRIAVHPSLWRRGLGRGLVAAVAEELAGEGYPLLGTGFAATPDVIRFWKDCGLVAVRLGVTRSRVSGEHSLIMLRGLSPEGERLCGELARRYATDAPAILSDALRDLEPEVALEALSAGGSGVWPELDERDWRDIVAATFGHRLYDVTVRPIVALVRAHLANSSPPIVLPERERRRLLLKVVQRRRWGEVAADLGEPLHVCMRGLRGALAPLVEAYGPEWLLPLVERFRGARSKRRGRREQRPGRTPPAALEEGPVERC